MEPSSLQEISFNAAAISLFCREKPREKLRMLLEDANFWTEKLYSNSHGGFFPLLRTEALISLSKLQNIANEELNSLNLPVTLTQGFKQIIIAISLEMLSWLFYFEKVGIYVDYAVVKEFFWLNNGNIDGEKTIERLLRNEMIQYHAEDKILTQFKLAILHSPKDVPFLILKDNCKFLNSFCGERKDYLSYFEYFEFLMIRQWSSDLTREKSISTGFFYWGSPTPFAKKMVLAQAINNRYFAYIKLYYDKELFSTEEEDEEEENEKNIEYLCTCLKIFTLSTNLRYPHSCISSLVLFVIKKLSEDELEKFLATEERVSNEILHKFLEFPFRHYFLKYAKIVQKIHGFGECIFLGLLIHISTKMEQDLKFYEEAFSFIWDSRPDDYKAAISILLNNVEDLILNLLLAGSFKNVKLVMSSISLEERKKFVSSYIDDILLTMTSYEMFYPKKDVESLLLGN